MPEDSAGTGEAKNMCEVLDKVEARGKAIGEEKANIANIRSLMKNLKMDSKQAMDALNIPASARAEYEEKLKR